MTEHGKTFLKKTSPGRPILQHSTLPISITTCHRHPERREGSLALLQISPYTRNDGTRENFPKKKHPREDRYSNIFPYQPLSRPVTGIPNEERELWHYGRFLLTLQMTEDGKTFLKKTFPGRPILQHSTLPIPITTCHRHPKRKEGALTLLQISPYTRNDGTRENFPKKNIPGKTDTPTYSSNNLHHDQPPSSRTKRGSSGITADFSLHSK